MTVESFFSSRRFAPDAFQKEAAASLADRRSVVVTAPTGAGKTLVADVAVHLALEAGRRAFYTTPIKALSNQKYGDLVAEYGEARVGLLTGDNVINGDAEIVVMTTEVLRNMIYAGSARIAEVGVVILDEVHYLQDPLRGAVWEEIIIHTPLHIQLVCLSATIANAEEFAGWVRSRRGETDLVVETERPVPLQSMYLLRDRHSAEPLKLLSTFTRRDGKLRPNARLERLLATERPGRRRFATPHRIDTIELLDGEGMLPAIFFIFSRAGCDAAALRALEDGVRLTDPAERDVIGGIVLDRTRHLSDSDLGVLDYVRFAACLEAGVAAHHAGMVPAFKETVEELFSSGLLKVVFATETLALGINMPARTVVLESLSKFNGETHELMQPGDYTQLTGRAGRRGIDNEGFGVVLHSPYVPLAQVNQIASIGSHPLRSSFRPTYNMAANLVANYARPLALELLSASFAQYQRKEDYRQADVAVKELEKRLLEEESQAVCHLGDIDDYLRQLDQPAVGRSTGPFFRIGDVVDIPGGPRAGRHLIIRRLSRKEGSVRFLVLSTSGRTAPLGSKDLVEGSQRIGRLDLPAPFRTSDKTVLTDTVRRLRKLPPPGERLPAPPAAPAHPVAACPEVDQHVRWARRARRTRQRLDQQLAMMRRTGAGVVEDFSAIEELLTEWGYLSGWQLTEKGRRLRFIYNELDLLLVECIEAGMFLGLSPEELAALISVFVFEPRTDRPSAPIFPTPTIAERFGLIGALSDRLARRERSGRLTVTRAPDPGFVDLAHAWASGVELEDLPDHVLAPGDFVRVARQLVDLLRQVREAAPALTADARIALADIDRGVVAAGGAV